MYVCMYVYVCMYIYTEYILKFVYVLSGDKISGITSQFVMQNWPYKSLDAPSLKCGASNCDESLIFLRPMFD